MPQEKEKSKKEVTADEKPVRPVLVVSDKILSEYQTFLNPLLVGLADESVPVALVSGPGWEVEPVIPPSIEVIKPSLFNLPLFQRRANKTLFKRLVDFKPTVLHCLCEEKMSFVRRLAHQLDLPYILTVNSLQRPFRRFSPFSKHLAVITVPAETIANNISKLYPMYADKVKQIPIGTFIEEQSACFNGISRQVCIVMSAALKDESVFKNLLAAMRHLAIDGYEFMLFIIGKGAAEKKLRRTITALGISRMVTIVPGLQSWRPILLTADIFIRPCRDRSFNSLLLEAMSTTTTVAACKGGVDDLIIDNETAVVFKPDDEISIMNSLRKLLSRPEYARQLASTAQDYVKENHKVSTMVSSFLQTYRDAPKLLKD